MNRSAGYTLIEVLIMLAVTAILAATVLETVRASTANGLRIEQAARNATQDYITLASVRRAVEASRADYNDGEHRFVGDETQFSALTSYPVASGRGTPRAYSLQILNEESGAMLIYKEGDKTLTVQSWPNARAAWTYFVEINTPQQGVFGNSRQVRERIWSSQWPIQTVSGSGLSTAYSQALPLAARIDVTSSSGRTDTIVFEMPLTAAPRQRFEDMLGLLPQ